ncbi:MAG: DNA polymerase/3'-5' exonuclease PolX [Candidatus Sumerlaeia bacterium]
MDKKQIAALLERTGTLMELKGENVFHARAYYAAARALESFDGRLEDLASGTAEVKGIGQGMRQHIRDLLERGTMDKLEELEKAVPPGLLDMLRIPGFGPKKARAVYDALGLDSIEALEQAARAGRLEALAGFGKKSQEKILEGIALIRRHSGRFRLDQALPAAEAILSKIKAHKQVRRAELGGSLRRRRETIKDADILVTTRAPAEVMRFFVELPEAAAVIAHGETRSSIRLASGMACDLRAVAESEFPFALMYFTGSKEHNVALRQRAQQLGFKLNEYGLFPEGGDRSVRCRTEQDVFKRLGLAFIPPELREDMGEIEAAECGELPRLVEREDIRGILHIHTAASDGKCSIRDHIERARQMGVEWLGISDHSQYARYAGGLTPDRLRKQWDEIDRLNDELGGEIRLFKGIEADILPDGRVDYEGETIGGKDILEQFDFVIASVHSNFNLSEAEQTRRVLRALEHPRVTILGHPTGRLLLQREPYAINLEAVIEAAAERGVWIEINANPHRLDLDWRWVKRAIGAGVLCPLGPDAHDPDGLEDVWFGLGIARKGWCEARHVPNALTAQEIEREFKKRKG